jgi:MFS family permease
MSEANAAGRLGPIHLQPGVSNTHAFSLLYAAFFSVCMLAFLNFSQPYLLRVHLGVAPGDEGSLTGYLTLAQEIVVLLLVAPFGALSDRIGRRPVYVAGFVLIGMGYMACAMATSVLQLALFRMFFAVGSAAVGSMLAVVPADYPQEHSRGKLLGLVGVCNGLGMAIVVPLLSILPAKFEAAGSAPIPAGRWAFAVVMGLCLTTAVVLKFGLKPGTPGRDSGREPMLALLKHGLVAARRPTVALAYGSAFASRGDMIVVGAFFSLWVTRVGTAQGHTEAEALAMAGGMFVIVQLAALLWAPVMGVIVDRISRVAALAVAMGLAAVGYLCLGFIDDPLGPVGKVAAVLLGIGQMSAIVASQTLIGQEADSAYRGSIVGVYSFFGALGLIAVSVSGGILFDVWIPAAPFILVGGCNLLLLVWAVALMRRTAASEGREAEERHQ